MAAASQRRTKSVGCAAGVGDEEGLEEAGGEGEEAGEGGGGGAVTAEELSAGHLLADFGDLGQSVAEFHGSACDNGPRRGCPRKTRMTRNGAQVYCWYAGYRLLD